LAFFFALSFNLVWFQQLYSSAFKKIIWAFSKLHLHLVSCIQLFLLVQSESDCYSF
jgi:hypothetical protein